LDIFSSQESLGYFPFYKLTEELDMSNKKQTSRKVAKVAAKVLRSPKSTRTSKTIAASAVAQAQGKKK
jgi:hypothetical protein